MSKNYSASSKPKLIFSLLDTPAFGGAEQYLISHLDYLQKNGYQIFVASNHSQVLKILKERLGNKAMVAKAPYRLDAIGNWKGLIKYFLSLPHSIAWLVWTLIKLKQEYQVICYLPGFSDRLTFSPFIKLLGLPLIWIDIAPLEPLFVRLGGIPKFLYLATKNLPDHIVCTSQWTLDSLAKTAGIDREKMTLIYPGVELWGAAEVERFKKTGAREFRNIGLAGKTVIGYLGRLASENEVELVIKAFAQILKNEGLKNGSKLRLLIIGDGPDRNRLENLITKLKIDKQVVMTGFVEEKIKYSLLSKCDLFTFTRAWDIDGFGITTIEAMSLGVPVITSDFGPQREVVEDGVSGMRFEPHSVKSLAEKISYLIKNSKFRLKFAKQGQKAVERFTNKKQLKKLEFIFF